MENVEGKTAFITGAGAGMGLGMARVFVDNGMKVVITDIRQNALDRAMEYFRARNQENSVHTIRLDVRDRDAFAEAADEAEKVFGNIHILVSNAGVSCGGKLAEVTYEDWDFGFGIKVGGTINAVTTILPRIIRHGEGGHVVATSSTNGFSATPGFGIYCSGMFAIAGMMESLASELDGTNVSASVFFPGPIQTELDVSTTELRREILDADSKQALPQPPPEDAELPDFSRVTMSSEEAGHRVLRGIRRNDLFIMTHPEFAAGVKARMDALLRSFPDEPEDPERLKAIQFFGPVWRNPYYDKQTKPGPPDWD